MSAYKKIRVELKDRDLLVAALGRLGVAHEVHEGGKTLVAYQGPHRQGRAEIVVSGASIASALGGMRGHDVGFAYDKAAGRYDMVVNDMDARNGFVDKVKQAYALVAIEGAMRAHGFDVAADDESLTRRVVEEVSLCGTKVI